jgi:hypothetical protein
MSGEPDFIATEQVDFQGRITASVSHEINNVLATISETAGLLADLTELGMSGRPLDASELRRCADTVVEEVKRGFSVVKNLNAFAHSGDEPVAEVDLTELVDLVSGLTRYVSFSCRVETRSVEGSGPRVTTRPLLLEDLVYRSFIHGFRAVGPDGSIGVCTTSDQDGGRIVISGLGGTGVEGFLDDDVRRIVHALGAHVETDTSRGEVLIRLPALIEIDGAESFPAGSVA